MWKKDYTNVLKNMLAEASLGGGEAKVRRQHDMGKLTAFERMDLLFDKGTFVELGALRKSNSPDVPESKKIFGDGVVVGYGKVCGRLVYASSQDFTVNGGTLGECHSKKICEAMDLAIRARVPFISINDGGGARVEEGVSALSGYSGIFRRHTMASGLIPQISVILGPCAGGACYSPALCDFIFMTEHSSQMFITGPNVVKAVTGEDTNPDSLGGSSVHSTKSGVSHFVCKNDKECIAGVRKLLQYLPQNNGEKPAASAAVKPSGNKDFESIVPDNYKQAYDVREVVANIVDDGNFLEIQPDFAKNVVAGLARLEGNVIGVVANQPRVLAGSLDVDASDKAARFVRFCDCFNIPLLTLVDVPGYMPGIKQEHLGIIRHGAKLLYAYSEATIPKITLIMRKAFGGAYIAMNSKSIGADYVFAWPIAQIAVMGSDGAVDIIHRRDIQEAEDPAAAREKLVSEYEAKFLNPYIAARNGFIDEVVFPKDTRKKLCVAFESLRTKQECGVQKKHGNIPL